MTTPRKEPLDAQEREWADRLARIGPHGEPAPGVDAAIIAAARAAADSPRRQPKRWPAVAGLAAMLALAVGVTWQLRPTQEMPAAAGEAPAAAVQPVAPRSAEPAPAPKVHEPPSPPPQAVAPPPPPPPVAEPATPARPSTLSAPPSPPAPPAPPAPSATAEPGASGSSRMQREVRTVPEGISDPAPMDIPEGAGEAAAKAAASASHQRLSRASSAAPAAAAADRSEPVESRAITVDDLPVEADLGLTPEVWIERIRQRSEHGDLESARRSLDALRHAHPDMELPPDLAVLGAAPNLEQ